MKTLDERLSQIQTELLSIGDDLCDDPGEVSVSAYWSIQSAYMLVRCARILMSEGKTGYLLEKFAHAKLYFGNAGFIIDEWKSQNRSEKETENENNSNS